MKRLLALTVLIAALGFGGAAVTATDARAECYRPNCWGAIAIGTNNGAWAWVVNHPSAGSARHRARVKCRGRCNRVLTFRNSCAAYATARNGGWGWSSGYRNRGGAVQRAMRECRVRNPGRGCRLRVWACTSR